MDTGKDTDLPHTKDKVLASLAQDGWVTMLTCDGRRILPVSDLRAFRPGCPQGGLMDAGEDTDLPSIAPDAQQYTVWYKVYRDGYSTHYTKDHVPGKGRPLVTVCVLTEPATGRQCVGYSICSPRDTPNRKRGRSIDSARAEKAMELNIPYHIYKQGLGKTPRRVLAACRLGFCIFPCSVVHGRGQWIWLVLLPLDKGHKA